jgi:hypothetical protein
VESDTTIYHSNTGFDAFVNAVIVSSGLALLIGPIWALQFVADNVKRLVIITGFIVLFTVVLTSAVAAKPFETLTATAAYVNLLSVVNAMDSNGV